MSSIRFIVQRGADEIACVETATVDDFYYFRDSIHAVLEDGDFGSRFPIFMNRFEPSEWAAEEVERLREELETIAQAFKQLPPEPPDGNWASKLLESGRQCTSLFDVLVDNEGRPLLSSLIDLCVAARKAGKSILMK